MKKLALALAIASAVAAPAAMAATYKIDTLATNNVYFYIDGATQVNWNLSNLRLVVNDTSGAAALSGTMTRTGSAATYSLAMAFTTPYSSATGISNWQDFTGAITNLSTGNTEVIRDFQAGRGAMDSALGVNVTPYNGANTSHIEMGFWAYNAGTKRHDFNVSITCLSGTGSTGPANANGTCTTGGGNVPLPGTLALFGLAAVGMGARRMKLV